jgi:anti-sigma-K factor RskA
MSEKRPTSELLAAYVDGVGELEVEERRRVERYLSDPALRAEQEATRDIIDQLRALPDDEPQVDWAAMERAIHAEVGDDVPRRSWFYRWRFALPAFALAGAAAIVFVITRGDETDDVVPVAFVKSPIETPAPVIEQVNDRVTVYLDGTDLEITDDMIELDELAIDDSEAIGDEASLGFLEPADLAWIDDLDDDALDRAEQALAKLPEGS